SLIVLTLCHANRGGANHVQVFLPSPLKLRFVEQTCVLEERCFDLVIRGDLPPAILPAQDVVKLLFGDFEVIHAGLTAHARGVLTANPSNSVGTGGGTFKQALVSCVAFLWTLCVLFHIRGC